MMGNSKCLNYSQQDKKIQVETRPLMENQFSLIITDSKARATN